MDPKKPSPSMPGSNGLTDLSKKLEALEQELLAAKQEVDRLKDLAARSQADLQNAKIRLQKEAADSRIYAVEGLLRTLIPTVDNFRRAFRHLPSELAEHEWVKGLQATEQALLRDLQSAGLVRMECLGQPVDPHHHEVLQMAPGPKDQILQIHEDGYELHGKVLRPAKVVVGNGEGDSSLKSSL